MVEEDNWVLKVIILPAYLYLTHTYIYMYVTHTYSNIKLKCKKIAGINIQEHALVDRNTKLLEEDPQVSKTHKIDKKYFGILM